MWNYDLPMRPITEQQYSKLVSLSLVTWTLGWVENFGAIQGPARLNSRTASDSTRFQLFGWVGWRKIHEMQNSRERKENLTFIWTHLCGIKPHIVQNQLNHPNVILKSSETSLNKSTHWILGPFFSASLNALRSLCENSRAFLYLI